MVFAEIYCGVQTDDALLFGNDSIEFQLYWFGHSVKYRKISIQ